MYVAIANYTCTFHYLYYSQEGSESELKELIAVDLPTSASSVQAKDSKESDTTSSQSNY